MQLAVFGLLLPVIVDLLVIPVGWLLFIRRTDLAKCVASKVIMNSVEVIHDEHLLRVGSGGQVFKEWIACVNALRKSEIRTIVSTA